LVPTTQMKTGKSPKHKQRTLFAMILVFIFFSMISNVFQENLTNNTDPLKERNYILPLNEKSKNIIPIKSPLNNPSLAIHPFQASNISILFIVGNESSPHPIFDQPFYKNITSLGFSVIYHDANNSYNYSEYDAIIISDSIFESGDVASLGNAAIPILTMEPETWDIFHLGSGSALRQQQDIWIKNTSHYITNQMTLGSLEIYNTTTELNYIKGYNALPSESDIFPLGLVGSKTPYLFYGTLIALERGGIDYTGVSISTERRAFLGTSQGEYLSLDGWRLWNNTLKWILYDDYSGNASITVNVEDLNHKEISNAKVTLFNSSANITQYTNIMGNTTFYNISWGLYNIKVEFDIVTNDSLISVQIVPDRTYHHTAQFTFNIKLSLYTDITPPKFNNIHFNKDLSQGTFYVDVIDENLLNSSVTLNITAINLTSGLEVVEANFTMVFQTGNTFYNDTALDTLTDITNISIKYNIIAEDTAGNVNKTELISFLLSDPNPPIIHELSVTDYGDGALEFYANITDVSGVEGYVLLKINGTLKEMHLNGSGFWTYRTQSFFGDVLNYIIFSVNDTVGNENGSKIPSFPMEVGYITISDSIPPQIDWITPYTTHDKGLVEWNIRIHETTIYQSGLDFNSVNITISVNSNPNNTQSMYDLGAGYFYYYGAFTFNDIVEFWINASDLVGNFKIEYGIMIINDTANPQVTFNAIEFGNGTVEFIATVVDWPSNITTVFIHENSTGSWLKYDLNQIDNNLYVGIYSNFSYSDRDLFYYAEAIDEAGNNNTLQFKYLTLTDIVPPDINLAIENSRDIDGQITINSFAIDSWGSSHYVNSPFYVNITHQDITTTHQMEEEIIYYVSTHSFKFSDQITITVWTYDEAGNQGVISELITIDDLAPPNIKNHGSINFQNGTVLIWAEVVEGIYGSGLSDNNSSVMIDIIHVAYQHETMAWNGSGNFYTFSLQEFTPGEAFTYQITAKDKNENENITSWKPVSILDLTPPFYKSFSYSEQIINHTATELSFWVEVDDSFGTIGEVNITINYFDGYHWVNWTDDMSYNGSHYIYSIQLTCNNTFSYRLTIYDEAANTNETPILSCKTSNFQPTTAQGHGLEFGLLELNPGEVRLWAKINDTFEEHNFEDHYIALSVLDESIDIEILTEELMEFNGTHHIYDLAIDYLHNFSYIMQIIDDGVLGGYYDPREYSNSSQMLDYWKPIILSSGLDQINETTIIIWANVSDWGSGVTEVLLKYEFVSYEGNGGAGVQVTPKKMNYNGSLYIAELTFLETGTISWFIEAYDNTSFVSSSIVDHPIIFPTEGPIIPGFTLIQIILTVLITAVIIIFILYGRVTFQRYRNIRRQKVQDLEDKLSLIRNIYSILITTEVGVPIYSLTNVIYQTDGSLDDAFSGLSVGIDSFLQSFQTDFMQQVQQHDLEYHVETRLDEKIRISFIEQNQFQIMIAASTSYRIFMFLKEKPSPFAKDALYKTIKELEKNVSIPNLGIVDESYYGPQATSILRKYLPIPLLMPFSIDTRKLKIFDEKLKQGLEPIPISQAGINALKRLVVTQTVSKMKTKTTHEEIKLFDKAMQNGLLKQTRKLLFNDAMNIMTKLLKIPSNQIYDALWIGCSPNVDIIVPQED